MCTFFLNSPPLSLTNIPSVQTVLLESRSLTIIVKGIEKNTTLCLSDGNGELQDSMCISLSQRLFQNFYIEPV